VSARHHLIIKENALTMVHRFVNRDMVTQYFSRGVAHLDQIQHQHEGMAQAPAKSSEDEDKMGASGLEVEAVGL
jgi:hypothetical protein